MSSGIQYYTHLCLQLLCHYVAHGMGTRVRSGPLTNSSQLSFLLTGDGFQGRVSLLGSSWTYSQTKLSHRQCILLILFYKSLWGHAALAWNTSCCPLLFNSYSLEIALEIESWMSFFEISNCKQYIWPWTLCCEITCYDKISILIQFPPLYHNTCWGTDRGNRQKT